MRKINMKKLGLERRTKVCWNMGLAVLYEYSLYLGFLLVYACILYARACVRVFYVLPLFT